MDKSPTPFEVIFNGVAGTWYPGNPASYRRDQPETPFTISIPGTGFAMRVTNSANLQKPRQKYPPLFENFWAAYHQGRREGKREAFDEWKKITPSERVALPDAAAAYTAKMQLENTLPRHILHPHRFIKTGRFEDYVGQGRNEAGLEAVEFWEMQFKGTMGVPYPWKGDERDNLVADVRAMGLDSWKDKTWYFFAGNNQKVKAAKDELGTHYNTFRSLMTGPLAYSGTKRKAACSHCGNTTGHSHECPVSQKRRLDAAALEREIEDGREAGLAALANWRKR